MAILFVVKNMTFAFGTNLLLKLKRILKFSSLIQSLPLASLIYITATEQLDTDSFSRTQNRSSDGRWKRKTLAYTAYDNKLSVNQNTNKNTNKCLVIYSYK
jgi:uncharacterized membrane protein YkvI